MAPIVEAILEFRIGNAQLPVESLERVAFDLPGWADAQHETIVTNGVQVSPEGVTPLPNELIGYAFTRSDGKCRIQVQSDRFAYSRSGTYSNWEEFSSEALIAWRKAYEAFGGGSLQISRIGTRFINLITVPAPEVEISDYVRTSVQISPYLPQGLAGFFMQVTIPLDPQLRIATTVTSSLAPPPQEGHSALILDLDTYDETELGFSGDEEELGLRLERLRLAKNYVFEASVTDATRGLISDGNHGT